MAENLDCPEEPNPWDIVDMGENGTPNRAEENSLVANMQTIRHFDDGKVYWT